MQAATEPTSSGTAREPVNVVILGATKGMGRSLARRMAERGDRLVLLGRDLTELDKSAADLAARSPEGDRPATALCDLEDPRTFAPALDAAEKHLGRVETVVLTAGVFAREDDLAGDAEAVARLLTVDFTHAVFFLEQVRHRLLAQGGGTLCAFSSVSGDRGRKPAVLYGAAKAGLSCYLEGLDHRHHGDGLRVVCVKPGFIKTGMTAGLPVPPFAGEPDQVAEDVLAAIDRGTPVVYTPSAWRWVMLVIRNLPRFVMRRLNV